MTPNGRRCLEILVGLTDDYEDGEKWFTAKQITKRFTGLENRAKPVMTVSSYLTHLKRAGYVERRESSDKLHAWWRITDKGRRDLRNA